MEEIFRDPLIIDSFQKLEVIKVKRCGRLEYLFLPSQIDKFSQPVEIEVSDCSSMKNIVLLESGITIDEIESIPVRSLTLQRLPVINGFCSNGNLASPDIPTLFPNAKAALPHLKHLKLINVSIMERLVLWDHGVTPLQNLEEMEIVECNDLHYLFVIEGVDNIDLLRHLRQLCLRNLDSFRSIVGLDNHHRRILNFQMLNHLTVSGCKQLKYVLPLYVLEDLQQLQIIDISECEKLEQVFADEQDKQMTKSTVKEMLSHLISLKLSNLPELASMCTGAGDDVISGSLARMSIENCPKLIFSFVYKLGRIEKEEASKIKGKQTIITLSKLETLDLHEVNHLKKMCEGAQVGFMYVTNLRLWNCNKLEYLFSLSMAKELSRLIELKIISCESIEQIMKREMQERAADSRVEFPGVKTLILERLPKFVGSSSRQDGASVKWLTLDTVKVTECPIIQKSMLGTVDRPLLKDITVESCTPLGYEDRESKISYLFHLTDELAQLEELKIKNSEELKKYMEMDLQAASFSNLRIVEARQCDQELNKFLSILLNRSYRLERLTVERCELLEHVLDLTACDANLKFPNLNTMQLLGLPNLKCIWNKDPRGILELGKLTKLEINGCGLRKTPISTALLEQLILLEELKIESCRMIEQVVEDDTETIPERPFPKLKDLQLVSLPKLIKFNSSGRHCNFRFPNLQSLRIEQCHKLNAFTTGFLSNQTLTSEGTSDHVQPDENMGACSKLQRLKLVGHESFEEIWQGWVSNNITECELKEVVVDSFSKLKYIFPSSMLPLLSKKLETLVVTNCTSLSKVFQGAVNDSITAFNNLNIVRVKGCHPLQRLLIPCSYPRLTEIEISDCRRLEEIFIDLEIIKANEKWFPYLKSIVLEDLPMLSSFSLEIFEFLTLKNVRIVNCPAIKTFSSNVSATDSTESRPFGHGKTRLLPELQELELSGLPKMQLWNRDPQIQVFEKLTKLKIIGCGSIKNLFSISVAQHLSSLKWLTLYKCEKMVRVLEGGTGTDKQVLVFHKLETLVLKRLKELTSFCEEDVDFDKFPELKMVRVENVPKMNTFVKKSLNTPKLKQVHVTFITKCWKGNLNETIKYLHENPASFRVLGI